MLFVKLPNKQTSDKTLSASLYCSFLLKSWTKRDAKQPRERKKWVDLKLEQEFVCLILWQKINIRWTKQEAVPNAGRSMFLKKQEV